jgi:hypothetical protein
MIVVHPKPIKSYLSYDLPLQPVGPFMMLEYVSEGTTRKDYKDKMYQYEHGLKCPITLKFLACLELRKLSAVLCRR